MNFEHILQFNEYLEKLCDEGYELPERIKVTRNCFKILLMQARAHMRLDNASHEGKPYEFKMDGIIITWK